jgi:hypothetical protein
MAKDKIKAQGVKNKEKVKAASGRRQVAALPFRYHCGLLEILIIISRESGRFIIPKGWPR